MYKTLSPLIFLRPGLSSFILRSYTSTTTVSSFNNIHSICLGVGLTRNMDIRDRVIPLYPPVYTPIKLCVGKGLINKRIPETNQTRDTYLLCGLFSHNYWWNSFCNWLYRTISLSYNQTLRDK